MPKGSTPTEKIALWADLVDATEELVKVGLRRKIGPQGDLQKAFRDWLEQQYEEHDRTVIQMMRNIRRR